MSLVGARARAQEGRLEVDGEVDMGDADLSADHVAAVAALVDESIAARALTGPATPTPPAPGVRLDLRRNPLGPLGGAAVGRSSLAPRLISLHLGDTGLGDGGLAQLVGISWPRLRRLTLWSNDLSPDSATLLARSRLWGALEALDLSDNDLGVLGARRLALAPATALQRLDLSWNGLDGFAAEGVALAHPTTGVSVYENCIGEGEARDLAARAPNLAFPRWD